MAELFLGEITQTGNLVPMHFGRKDTQDTRARKMQEAKRMLNTANKLAVSVGDQFKNSLNILVDKMSACRPHFVRCIKPNTVNQPFNFDDKFVMVQLNYTGGSRDQPCVLTRL